MIETLDLANIRIILALGMLGYTSYTDLIKREVSDFVWIIFAALGIMLLFFEPNSLEFLLNVGIALIIAPFALIIWRIGLFGGADAFAVIVLAVLVPQTTISENVVTPFTILTNAVVFSVFPLFFNFFRNLVEIVRGQNIFEGFKETKKKRVLALFIGYKAKNPKFGFSIEKKSGKHKKLNLVMHHAESAEFCKTPNTWITPGIPYMLFIAAGFVAQLLYGDILFNFLGLTF